MPLHRPTAFVPVLAVAVTALLAACATPSETPGPLRKDHVLAVTAGNELLRFNAGQPQKVLDRKRVTGLAPQETLVGIDFRIARGLLYGLGSTGRLYRIDPATGVATAVGAAPAFAASGVEYGFDFNPTVDRIRVVTPAGSNLRLHPDTGAQVDGDANAAGVQNDGALAYAAGDANAGKAAGIVAAGYTYNKDNEKITSNFAIDAGAGTLALQGSREGVTPAVSPNTGRLTTVGTLGVPSFASASFDIADVTGEAYLAARVDGRTRWYQVDLATGHASFVGTLGANDAIRGVTIEP